MLFKRDGQSPCSISLLQAKFEVFNECKYFKVMIGKDDSKKANLESRVLQGGRTGGGMRALVNGKGRSVECARSVHNRLLVPALMDVYETFISLGLAYSRSI